VKRAFDLVLVLATLPFWGTLVLAVAVAVRIAMGAPVFFRQRRAGLGGREFSIIKFRTMREGTGPDAERLTRFGKFLRATSLDELPELWNVLRGEMSLVGPRPLPVRYLPRYSPEQARRHETLPGITGWAQIHGRNALDWEAKFRYDVEYVDRRSLALDVKILAITVFQVLFPRNISHDGEATMTEFTPLRTDTKM
jgi:lipopolysaccharide/colanic/teichoic acid biosynthesis glycosyltransferase